MAKINQYPAKTVPSNNDEFVLHDPASGSTKKMTRGDLIGGAPLPANSVNGQAIADGSVTPEKRSGGFKIIEHNFTGSTGTNKITGVGFKPKGFTCVGMTGDSSTQARQSHGMADESGTQSGHAFFMQSGSFASKRDTSAAFVASNASGGQTFRGVVTSWDDDGITVNVTNGGSFTLDRQYFIAFYG